MFFYYLLIKYEIIFLMFRSLREAISQNQRYNWHFFRVPNATAKKPIRKAKASLNSKCGESCLSEI